MNDLRHKRGDVRSDGKVFWRYGDKYKNGEQWVTAEQATRMVDRARKKVQERYKNDPDFRRKCCERQRSIRSDATRRARIRERNRIYHRRPDVRDLRIQRYKENMKNASYRDLVNARQRQKSKTAERKRKRSEYHKLKKKHDVVYCIKTRLRKRTTEIFNRLRLGKPSRTEDLLGVCWLGLKNHIESLFLDGMSWDNRDLWHIDHIIPLASAKTTEMAVALCHYTNLRPLWARDNISKGSKILPSKPTTST